MSLQQRITALAQAVAADIKALTAGKLSTTGTAADASKLGGNLAAEFYRRANILGTVSQAGGVPTGAIIERGSNANGEYVRFADGTQICTMLIQGGIAMGSYGSTGLYMGVLVCQFPAVFANAPSISGVSTDQNNLGWVTSNGIGQGVANIYHITASSTVTSTAIFLLAIGRWF
jgi:hypothetical protein